MTPHTLLDHLDQGRLWPAPSGLSLDEAYAQALAVRQLRMARGEQPRGYKVGFTNRTIWPRYNVFAPIWGSVWDSTLTLCEGEGSVSLAHTCQPRLEPEVVFGLKATPARDATLDDLFAAIDWVAPGFEVVQSHLPDWKFVPADTVTDGGLHHHRHRQGGAEGQQARALAATRCAHLQLFAMRAAHASASSRVGTSMIENPPTTAFVSGTGPGEALPSIATIVACWRRTPPPKIHTPAAFASQPTTLGAGAKTMLDRMKSWIQGNF